MLARASVAGPLSDSDPQPRLARPPALFLAGWAARMVAVVLVALLVGALLPVVGGVDRWLFAVINELGHGPDVVYDALDPHERNYRAMWLVAVAAGLIAGGPWRALGVAFAVLVGGVAAYYAMEVVALTIARPRPELLVEDVFLTHGRSWAGLASYPSGHVAATTGIAVSAALALPVLRWPLAVYAILVAWSRIAFGAHYPLDVLAGLAIGAVGGAFAVALARAAGLLPGPRGRQERSSGAA